MRARAATYARRRRRPVAARADGRRVQNDMVGCYFLQQHAYALPGANSTMRVLRALVQCRAAAAPRGASPRAPPAQRHCFDAPPAVDDDGSLASAVAQSSRVAAHVAVGELLTCASVAGATRCVRARAAGCVGDGQ